jgi:hypothetical protein
MTVRFSGSTLLKTWAGTHNRLVLLLVVAGIVSLTQIGASKVLSDQFPCLQELMYPFGDYPGLPEQTWSDSHAKRG